MFRNYYSGSRLTPLLGSFYYTVQPGDTLYAIARKFNTTVDILSKFNAVRPPYIIYIGSRLIIPESPAEAIIYTIRPGDTLYSIAVKFRTSVKNLIDFNYLTNPNLIFPGRDLVVTASLRF